MITSVGLQETQLKLRAFSGAINGPERLTIARAGGIVVQSEAKIRAPKKTGTLSRSIQMVNSGAGSVDVGTNLIYAAIQEFGGTIMGNPWLVFQTDDGEWHKVSQVTLPAQPYLRPAADESEGQINVSVTAAVNAILSRIF